MGRKKKEIESLPTKQEETKLSKFDVDAAKERLREYDNGRTSSKAKSESFRVAAQKQLIFMHEVGKRTNGWRTKAWPDADELRNAVSDYMVFTMENEIHPDPAGITLWLGIKRDTYYAMLQANDDRSEVLEWFNAWLNTLYAQEIATTEGNPAGNIYLDKSRLGNTDQPLEQTININMRGAAALPTSLGDGFAGGFPIDADFEELEEEDE